MVVSLSTIGSVIGSIGALVHNLAIVSLDDLFLFLAGDWQPIVAHALIYPLGGGLAGLICRIAWDQYIFRRRRRTMNRHVIGPEDPRHPDHPEYQEGGDE